MLASVPQRRYEHSEEAGESQGNSPQAQLARRDSGELQQCGNPLLQWTGDRLDEARRLFTCAEAIGSVSNRHLRRT